MYKIEKNIPIPPEGYTRRGPYPFARMEVGDSFLVPFADMITVRCAAGNYAKKYGAVFWTRFIEGQGVRVWRKV